MLLIQSTRYEHSCRPKVSNSASTRESASPHPRCGSAYTARPSSHVWTSGADRRDSRASAPRGLCTPRIARRHTCPVATCGERAGRNQHARRPRIGAAQAARARGRSLRLARSNRSRFVSMETKTDALSYALCAVVVLRAVVMSATAQITIAAATPVRIDSRSPAIAHPRNTATMGLTYA
jgi:hypothetical protein